MEAMRRIAAEKEATMMESTATKRAQVYRCEKCGDIVEILKDGCCVPVCCGSPMTLQNENTVDASKEKHVPVVQKSAGKVVVSVGSVEHPMLPEHYIEWIEVVTATKVLRKWLKPGDKPVAEFAVDEDVLYAREFCNLHRLWRS